MQKFNYLTGKSAVLPMVNVDTDMIIPKQFLKTIRRDGLGKGLFYDLRYDENGNLLPEFVLNRVKAQILITGANFGSGSSREHAPWALLDYGIRCLIAPSFADIFHNNCFQNGILPITLPQEIIDELIAAQEHVDEISVDLENNEIRCANQLFPFAIDPRQREHLLNGLDAIGLTCQRAADIDAFEGADRTERPWMAPRNTSPSIS